jgi:hypothetical protein
MTIGVIKGATVVAVVKELVEGVAMDPTLGSEFCKFTPALVNDSLNICCAK